MVFRKASRPSLGVSGSILSPSLFNLFINDIPKCFECLCMPVSLGNSNLNCLMNADDLVLLVEAASGLQNCLDATDSFCSKWGLNINYSKSKVMGFNKASKLFNLAFRINYIKLECVRELKYLGIVFSLNGSFTRALNDLYQRG